MPRLRIYLIAHISLVSVSAIAADFSGYWEHVDKDEVIGESRTMVSIVQRGNRVCGQWTLLNYRGKELSGNVIGVVKGALLQLRTDELIGGDEPPPPPNPDAVSFEQYKLRQGKLVQLDQNGKLPNRTTLASDLGVVLTKNRELDPSQVLNEEFLTECFSGPGYEGWNAGEVSPKKAKRERRATPN